MWPRSAIAVRSHCVPPPPLPEASSTMGNGPSPAGTRMANGVYKPSQVSTSWIEKSGSSGVVIGSSRRLWVVPRVPRTVRPAAAGRGPRAGAHDRRWVNGWA
jgi:hypothetical protein